VYVCMCTCACDVCVRALLCVCMCVYLRRCTCLVGIRNSFGDPSQPSPPLPPPPPRLGERALESISFEDRMCDICDGLDGDISNCKDALGISLGAANPVLGAAGKFLKSQVCSDFLCQMQY